MHVTEVYPKKQTHKSIETKKRTVKCRLMNKYNIIYPIRAPNPCNHATKSLSTNYVAPNLLAREFKKHGKHQILLTDITYIKRSGSEFTFLSVIIDAYTKQALAWACSTSLKVDLVLDNVNILIKNHGSEINDKTIIHHTETIGGETTQKIEIF